MITKYNLYNESLRDKIRGKSDEDIRDNISRMDIADTLRYIKLYNLDDSFLPTERQIYYYLMNLDIDEWLGTIKDNNLVDKFSVRLLPSDEEIKDYLITLSIDKWIRLVKRWNLDDSFLPTKKQIKDHIFNEDHMKDFRKKFYRKAELIPSDDKKIIELRSYNTIVAEYNNRTRKVKINGWYSRITSKHINEFIAYLGGDNKLSKKEMDKRPTIKI